MGKRRAASGSSDSGATRHVALLRGINVGGKHRLPMAELRRLFEEAGCTDVRTYIQSGNVVFAASPSVAKRVATSVASGVARDFGFDAPVIVRTAAELRRAIKACPFLGRGADEKALHVGFLERAPSSSSVARLDPERSPGDSFVLKGTVIYLHLPRGVARSTLTNAYFDSVLGVTSTFRNWRTVGALAELAAG